MKTKEEKQIKDYIERVWEEIVSIVPLINFYEIKYREKDYNNDGGKVSIVYNPEIFKAELNVFQSFFEQMPCKGLTEGNRNYIKMCLCHEAGHVYLWEFEGTERDIEKMATQIGLLIFNILDGRGI